MQRTAIIVVNGILTDPRRDNAWTDTSVDWFNTHCHNPVVTTSYEYNADIVFGKLGQSHRVKAIIERVKEYHRHGDRIILIGHSNGCDIIAKVLHEVHVDEAHLISPATDEKEIELGIAMNNVNHVHIYGSTRDMALKIGAQLSRFITFGLLGYGSLGLRGPALAAKWPGVVHDYSNNSFGHSTWITPRESLINTLRFIAYNSSIKLIP